MIDDLLASGAESTIDVALFVGGRRMFACSVVFEPGFLRQVAEAQLNLEVSGYPVSRR